jgi:hypothetical protein
MNLESKSDHTFSVSLDGSVCVASVTNTTFFVGSLLFGSCSFNFRNSAGEGLCAPVLLVLLSIVYPSISSLTAFSFLHFPSLPLHILPKRFFRFARIRATSNSNFSGDFKSVCVVPDFISQSNSFNQPIFAKKFVGIFLLLVVNMIVGV